MTVRTYPTTGGRKTGFRNGSEMGEHEGENENGPAAVESEATGVGLVAEEGPTQGKNVQHVIAVAAIADGV